MFSWMKAKPHNFRLTSDAISSQPAGIGQEDAPLRLSQSASPGYSLWGEPENTTAPTITIDATENNNIITPDVAKDYSVSLGIDPSAQSLNTTISVTSTGNGGWGAADTWPLLFNAINEGFNIAEAVTNIPDTTYYAYAKLALNPKLPHLSGGPNNGSLDFNVKGTIAFSLNGKNFSRPVNLGVTATTVYNVTIANIVNLSNEPITVNNLTVADRLDIGNAQLTAQGSITNSGFLQLDSNGILASAGSFSNKGQILAMGTSALSAESLTNTGAISIGAPGLFSISTSDAVSNQGKMIAAKGGVLSVGAITNNGLLQAVSAGVLQLNSNVENTGHAIVAASAGIIQLTSGEIDGGRITASSEGALGLGYGGTLSGVVLGGDGSGLFTGDSMTNVLDNMGGTLDNVTLQAGNTFLAEQYDYTDLAGVITNSGTFSAQGAGYSAPPGQFMIDGSVTLKGNGIFLLNQGGAVETRTDGSTLVNDGNLIEGDNGSVAVALTNEAGGIVDATTANGSGAGLRLYDPVSNHGTIEASDQGALYLNGNVVNAGSIEGNSSGTVNVQAMIQNVGHSITATDAGIIQLTSGEIDGGRITASSEGALGLGYGGTLSGVVLGGDGSGLFTGDSMTNVLDNMGGTLDNITLQAGNTFLAEQYDYTDLAGVITNSGTFSAQGAGYSAPPGQFMIDGSVTLKGNGIFLLNQGGAVETRTDGSTLVNDGNLIEGDNGSVAVALTNEAGGIVDATTANGSGAGLRLYDPVSNHGTIEASDQGALFFQGNVTNSSVIDDQAGSTVTFEASVQNSGIITAAGSATFDGSIGGAGFIYAFGTIQTEASVGAGEVFEFGSGDGILQIGDLSQFAGMLGGMVEGDSIDVLGKDVTSLANGSGSLLLKDGKETVGKLFVSGSYSSSNFSLSSDGNGGTTLVFHT